MFTPLPSAIRALRTEYVASGKAASFWHINDGLCDDFAGDVEARLGADSKGYWAVENGNFMTGADGDSSGNDVWGPGVLKAYGGLPAGSTLAQLNATAFGGHVRVTDGTTHYDAECPDGVSCLFNLPFFQRYLADASA